MPWGWGRGRGWRWMFWLTGLPGWMRARFGWPAFGVGWPLTTWFSGRVYPGYIPYAFWPGWFRGNPFWFCRWFPWLPRWWWTGIYGPVQWTPQGPVLASQLPQTQYGYYPYQAQMPMPQLQPINEIEALRQQKQMLEMELKDIEARIKELEGLK
ncbi:MAG TPA: hypothetical protein ENG66_06775 [Thermococcus sp.]|nr:hypothetical protein [Thermococcus sp.]